MKAIRTYIFILIGAIMLSACSKLTKIEKSNDNQKKLAYANELFNKKKYSKANTLYEELLKVYQGTGQFEDLYYRYAYSAYYLEDYTQAAFHFKNFVDYFPNSPKASEMDYMQAFCYYKLSPRVELDQSNTIKAIGAMQEFINSHPDAAEVKDANHIIDLCRAKLEQKEFNAAQLYYNLGYYNAAGITFTNLMRDYPGSDNEDHYKYMIIKSYYRYASNSVESKQAERYNKVINEYLDFEDHYPKSQYTGDAKQYYLLAQNNLKSLQNEQTKKKP